MYTRPLGEYSSTLPVVIEPLGALLLQGRQVNSIVENKTIPLNTIVGIPSRFPDLCDYFIEINVSPPHTMYECIESNEFLAGSIGRPDLTGKSRHPVVPFFLHVNSGKPH